MAQVQIGVLRRGEADAADRIMRLAFGTYLGLADPLTFLGDRNYAIPRSQADNAHVFVAREKGRLIGFCAGVCWGSFAVLGPIAVLPEYWNQGVAQRLLGPMTAWFDQSRVRASGLLTFSDSPRHVGLYQKFGYWPTTLIANLQRTCSAAEPPSAAWPGSWSQLGAQAQRREALASCRKLTASIFPGLDLGGEIEAALTAQGASRRAATSAQAGSKPSRSPEPQPGNDVVLLEGAGEIPGFAVCLHGAGTEAGSKCVSIKFAAVRGGHAAAHRFARLMEACEAHARALGVDLECGINLARRPAFEALRARGYRVTRLTIAMVRPAGTARTARNFTDWGWNHSNAWVLDDWR